MWKIFEHLNFLSLFHTTTASNRALSFLSLNLKYCDIHSIFVPLPIGTSLPSQGRCRNTLSSLICYVGWWVNTSNGWSLAHLPAATLSSRRTTRVSVCRQSSLLCSTLTYPPRKEGAQWFVTENIFCKNNTRENRLPISTYPLSFLPSVSPYGLDLTTYLPTYTPTYLPTYKQASQARACMDIGAHPHIDSTTKIKDCIEDNDSGKGP